MGYISVRGFHTANAHPATGTVKMLEKIDEEISGEERSKEVYGNFGILQPLDGAGNAL